MKMIVRVLFALLLQGVCAAVFAAPLQLTSSQTGNQNADYAVERTDASGNIHLVWTQDDTTDGRALYYEMLGSAGAVKIPAIRIDNGGTGGPAAYPSIAIDSTYHVYVVWQSGATPAVYFMRLNPLLEPRNGTPATLSTLKEVDDVVISPAGGDSAVHPRVEIDNQAHLYVVWESECTGPVQYVKLDTSGAQLSSAPVSIGPAGTCNGYPDLALDSDANVHVVFSSAAATAAPEVYYAMIDGATDAVLIDATLLTVDDGLLAGSATVSVNLGDNKVYIVYKQETGNGGPGSEEIYIDTLDPSRDARDGSAGDLAVLRTGLSQFTNGEGQYRWHVFSRIGQNRRLNLLYMDFDDAACPAGVYTLQYAQKIYDGAVLERQDLSTSMQSCSAWARLAHYGDRVVWPDITSAGDQEIFAAKLGRADAGSSGFFACTLHPAGSGTAARAGDLWVLLAGIAALGIRVARRRRVSPLVITPASGTGRAGRT
jgi:hypothetical protein